jgi:uncharacterized membrane protein
MPLRVRVWTLVAGLVSIFVLVLLLVYAPPDGRERAELAQFLGRFHPLIVHIPIALLLLVPVLECAGCVQEHLRQAAGLVLTIAAAGAIAAAGFGWLLAWSGGFEGSLVTRHAWGGVSLAAACVACWGVYRWKPRAYAAALLLTIGLLIWTSDQGGKLTHGANFLTERMPQPLSRWFGVERKVWIDPASFYATRVQPIFDQKCVLCHNAEKFKGKLRLDSYEHVMLGGKDGLVISSREPGKSEMYRRITLPPDSKDFMPAEGKPSLSPAETKIIESWIAAGATIHIPEDATRGLSPTAEERKVAPPLTDDYRPQLKTIKGLETSLGLRIIPRSQNPTDGLILRTASAPQRCTDATLAELAPVGNLIVDAELARTKVTDKGMQSLANFSNLRFLDLSATAVTSVGARELMKLEKLETLNLTQTRVTHNAAAKLQSKPGLKRLYLFETN